MLRPENGPQFALVTQRLSETYIAYLFNPSTVDYSGLDVIKLFRPRRSRLHVAVICVERQVDSVWTVTNSRAIDGLKAGPTMYELAMEDVGKIASDKTVTSVRAQNVWSHYRNRSDVVTDGRQFYFLDGSPTINRSQWIKNADAFLSRTKFSIDEILENVRRGFAVINFERL